MLVNIGISNVTKSMITSKFSIEVKPCNHPIASIKYCDEENAYLLAKHKYVLNTCNKYMKIIFNKFYNNFHSYLEWIEKKEIQKTEIILVSTMIIDNRRRIKLITRLSINDFKIKSCAYKDRFDPMTFLIFSSRFESDRWRFVRWCKNVLAVTRQLKVRIPLARYLNESKGEIVWVSDRYLRQKSERSLSINAFTVLLHRCDPLSFGRGEFSSFTCFLTEEFRSYIYRPYCTSYSRHWFFFPLKGKYSDHVTRNEAVAGNSTWSFFTFPN